MRNVRRFPKFERIEDVFTRLQETYGIDTTFFQKRLEMNRATFHNARRRGFYPREAEKLDAAFQEVGAAILTTRIPRSQIRSDLRWERKKDE